MLSIRSWLQAGAVALLASIYGPALIRTFHVLGVFRQGKSSIVDAADMVVIEDTGHCEDLHLHAPSNTLFAACEGSDTRFSWFPALGTLDDPIKAMNSRGSIHAIDPKTFKSKRLQLENFDGPFITHGIDVISDPDKPDAVYIFAVNHLPHPAYVDYKKNEAAQNVEPPSPKAASQIEVFYHVLGSPTAKRVRSIQHPLVKTPNDVLARSPTSVYVTNDHYYREGHMRVLEDAFFGGKWSDTVHIQIEQLSEPDPTLGLKATIALTGLHNNNGLGHGGSPNEIAIVSATSGDLHMAHVANGGALEVLETIHLDSGGDNPSFFRDAYATADNDSSGYVVPGLARVIDVGKTAKDPEGIDPVMVWLVRPRQQGGAAGQAPVWEKKLLFEDDGTRIRSASGAVLIGIDPKLEGGRKKAWLFVTGFSSANAVAVKVDLE